MSLLSLARPLPTERWLKVLREEYLDDFVPAGGSVVKVATGPAAELDRVRQSMEAMAREGNYCYAHLDPAATDEDGKKKDVHRIDRFFFEVTREVDFRARAAEQARRHLESRGIRISSHRALNDLEGIAADNGRDPADLMNQYQLELATPQLRDLGMAVEFRTAVTALGRAQLMPDSAPPTTEEVLLGWFAGRALPGGAAALKKVQIYDRITQANARTMLESFCRWLPRIGKTGLVVTLDFRPYEYKKLSKTVHNDQKLKRLEEAIRSGADHRELLNLIDAPEPFAVHYGDNAYHQMLSTIRRFIDEIDWFERLVLVILTSPDFYDASSPRNYFNYDALQTRIGLEVRGASRANPAASLVHLGGDA